MTLWTRPFGGDLRNNAARWRDARSHLAAWCLSVALARRHYEHIELVTDSCGAEALFESLQLPFDSVHTDLDDYNGPTDLWCVPKLIAMALQNQPFMQIDYDVFLWKPFPRRIEDAAIVAQNHEDNQWFARCYEQNWRRTAIACKHLPPSWQADTLRPYREFANCLCTGIMGGRHVALLRDYAAEVIAFVQHPENQSAWQTLDPLEGFNTVVEQYTLAAHCRMAGQPCEVLVDDLTESAARRVGFTHLMGVAKRNRRVCNAMLKRARDVCPEQLARVDRFLS